MEYISNAELHHDFRLMQFIQSLVYIIASYIFHGVWLLSLSSWNTFSLPHSVGPSMSLSFAHQVILPEHQSWSMGIDSIGP